MLNSQSGFRWCDFYLWWICCIFMNLVFMKFNFLEHLFEFSYDSRTMSHQNYFIYEKLRAWARTQPEHQQARQKFLIGPSSRIPYRIMNWKNIRILSHENESYLEPCVGDSPDPAKQRLKNIQAAVWPPFPSNGFIDTPKSNARTAKWSQPQFYTSFTTATQFIVLSKSYEVESFEPVSLCGNRKHCITMSHRPWLYSNYIQTDNHRMNTKLL